MIINPLIVISKMVSGIKPDETDYKFVPDSLARARGSQHWNQQHFRNDVNKRACLSHDLLWLGVILMHTWGTDFSWIKHKIIHTFNTFNWRHVFGMIFLGAWLINILFWGYSHAVFEACREVSLSTCILSFRCQTLVFLSRNAMLYFFFFHLYLCLLFWVFKQSCSLIRKIH